MNIYSKLSLKDKSRFYTKYTKGKRGECWSWRARLNNGYGEFLVRVNGRQYRLPAHRVAWYLLYGKLPETLKHSCGNRKCVNPEHLED